MFITRSVIAYYMLLHLGNTLLMFGLSIMSCVSHQKHGELTCILLPHVLRCTLDSRPKKTIMSYGNVYELCFSIFKSLCNTETMGKTDVALF